MSTTPVRTWYPTTLGNAIIGLVVLVGIVLIILALAGVNVSTPNWFQYLLVVALGIGVYLK